MKRGQRAILIGLAVVVGLAALFLLFEWGGTLLDSGGAIGG
ncbi:MAG: hypothetical protein ACRDWH_02985 [Acidimicrobiia bacterium]